MPRRNKVLPKIQLTIWKKDGDLYFAEPSELLAEIEKNAVPEETIKSRMGFGHHYIQDILDGKKLDIWAISHIEWGILKQDETYTPTATYPPLKY